MTLNFSGKGYEQIQEVWFVVITSTVLNALVNTNFTVRPVIEWIVFTAPL